MSRMLMLQAETIIFQCTNPIFRQFFLLANEINHSMYIGLKKNGITPNQPLLSSPHFQKKPQL